MAKPIDGQVTINLGSLKKYGAEFNKQLNGNASGPIADMVMQWGARYKSFAQIRFDKFSKGGGDWPALRPATIEQRRKQSSTILRDTNTLFAVLNPVFTNQPGAVEERIKGGIRVGFGGTSKHPEGDATVADIAYFHHKGLGNLPERKILEAAPRVVVKNMLADAARAHEKLKKQTGSQ